jgi:transcriptional regulator with XRE-family HTH domain
LVYPGGADLHRPGVSMSGEAGNPYTGIEIGRSLRLAREKRGLSLQQVEEATKIRTRYLRDLENENFDVLPTVYMLGSLKTYAEHLGLDGAAIARELKRRQSSLQPEQDQAPEDSPSGELRGLLASLGRLAGIGGTVEDEAGTMTPVHRPGLYVSLVVVLVFVLATYLASTIRGDDQPSVSLVQEPTVSQFPSGVVLVGNVEDDERNSEDVGKENQPEKQTESPAKNGKIKAEQSGQEEYVPRTSQLPSSSAPASASASAGASASALSAYIGSASAPATVAPERTRVRPQPAAGEQRGGEGMVAPANPPARVSRSQSFHETQAGPVDATRLGDGVPDKVKKALDSAW